MNKSCFQKNKQGFTLVELAIVLTIVALIIGGIISGEKLVDGYRTASVVSNFEKYKTAYNDFQTQYMALPGDMSDASSVFPAVGSISAAGDGGGNGKIDGANEYSEEFKAWQHLGRAQLIVGQYTGTGSASNLIGGVNVASGPHESSMFRMVFASPYSNNGHQLIYSKSRAGCSNCDKLAIITASDAYSIDLKVDDGVYNKGRLTAPDTSLYDDSGTAVICADSGGYKGTDKKKICTISYSIE